jgi:hypothetical protein
LIVHLNGAKVASLRADWDKWESRDFQTVDLPLKAGENTLEFVDHNPAIKSGTDNRARAIAVKNLGLTTAGN